MPELPEVEVLVRYLDSVLPGRRIRTVDVWKDRSIRPHSVSELRHALAGAQILSITRRAKSLQFHLTAPGGHAAVTVVGHLGMTGRMRVESVRDPVSRHAVLALGLGMQRLVFEDPRQFGRFHLGGGFTERLGPEPLDDRFTPAVLAAAIAGSRQPIKTRLMNQGVIAGIGNIYASEALFGAGVSPSMESGDLRIRSVERLWKAIRDVLSDAIAWGASRLPDVEGNPGRLFHHPAGSRERASADDSRFRVYDREGLPCLVCREGIVHRIHQAGRSTYFCPVCQPDAGDEPAGPPPSRGVRPRREVG